LLAACTATFYVALRLRESGDVRVYLALGLGGASDSFRSTPGPFWPWP